MRIQVFRVGDRVSVPRGKYKGNKGIILRVTPCKAYVRLDDLPLTPLLWKTSLRIERNIETPSNYILGILEAFPDIDEQLEQLCNSLARCSVNPRSVDLREHMATRIEHHAEVLRQGFGSYIVVDPELQRLNTTVVPSGRVLVVDETD